MKALKIIIILAIISIIIVTTVLIISQRNNLGNAETEEVPFYPLYQMQLLETDVELELAKWCTAAYSQYINDKNAVRGSSFVR